MDGNTLDNLQWSYRSRYYDMTFLPESQGFFLGAVLSHRFNCRYGRQCEGSKLEDKKIEALRKLSGHFHL